MSSEVLQSLTTEGKYTSIGVRVTHKPCVYYFVTQEPGKEGQEGAT